MSESPNIRDQRRLRRTTARSPDAKRNTYPACHVTRISHTSQQTVLIVDDDRQIAEGTAIRLQAEGYSTLIACNGAEGISVAHRHDPDAIVLDIRMPVMDGIEALRELKGHPSTKEIPVVMLSASVVDEGPALDGGARFFVRKPFDRRRLVEAVNVATNE